MERIGRYEVIREVGRGGMAIVYQARDTTLDRIVAVKLIRSDIFGSAAFGQIRERFDREARALAKLNHPNIVKVLDYGEHQDAPYLVMEYLKGATLKEVKKPIRVETAVRLLRPVAEALDYIHQQGILHRDVKPSNIMLVDGKTPMLTDFGIAKWIEDETDGRSLTGTGVGIGTPEYMAPEQGLGKQVDGRADMYSLTIAFYELITGQKPFRGDTALAILMKQATEPIPDPRAVVPELSESVKRFLDRALAKDPEDRYPTFTDYLRDLDGLGLQSIANRARGTLTGIQTTPASTSKTDSSVRIGATDLRKLRGEQDEAKEKSESESAAFSDLNKLQIPIRPVAKGRKSGKIPKLMVFFFIAAVAYLIIMLIDGLMDYSKSGAIAKITKTGDIKTEAVADISTTPLPTKTKTPKPSATASVDAGKVDLEINSLMADQNRYKNYDEVRRTLDILLKEAIKIDVEGSGSIKHYEDDYVEVFSEDSLHDLKDFILEVTFNNPYSSSVHPFDFGLLFRHNGGNDQYRLWVDSDSYWRLSNHNGGTEELIIDDGFVENLKTGSYMKNSILLIVRDRVGLFYVNNRFVAKLDLSDRLNRGSIEIATGFLNGHEKAGYSTGFEEFSVYKLENRGSASEFCDPFPVGVTSFYGNKVKYVLGANQEGIYGAMVVIELPEKTMSMATGWEIELSDYSSGSRQNNSDQVRHACTLINGKFHCGPMVLIRDSRHQKIKLFPQGESCAVGSFTIPEHMFIETWKYLRGGW